MVTSQAATATTNWRGTDDHSTITHLKQLIEENERKTGREKLEIQNLVSQVNDADKINENHIIGMNAVSILALFYTFYQCMEMNAPPRLLLALCTPFMVVPLFTVFVAIFLILVLFFTAMLSLLKTVARLIGFAAGLYIGKTILDWIIIKVAQVYTDENGTWLTG